MKLATLLLRLVAPSPCRRVSHILAHDMSRVQAQNLFEGQFGPGSWCLRSKNQFFAHNQVMRKLSEQCRRPMAVQLSPDLRCLAVLLGPGGSGGAGELCCGNGSCTCAALSCRAAHPHARLPAQHLTCTCAASCAVQLCANAHCPQCPQCPQEPGPQRDHAQGAAQRERPLNARPSAGRLPLGLPRCVI